MKWNIRTLGLLTCTTAIAVMCTLALVAKTDGAANGKEVAGIAGNELVVAKTQIAQAGQIGQQLGDVAMLNDAYCIQIAAPADTERVATPNAANSDQVAIRAAQVTDQLALKTDPALALTS